MAERHYQTEIEVTSDRVLLECEDIVDHDNKDDPDGNFGFMIHLLDESNTVTTLIRGTVLGRVDCQTHIRGVEKVIKRNGKARFGGSGLLDQARQSGEAIHQFPRHGKFPSNGRVLGFTVVWNEHGDCYGTNGDTPQTCMPEDFPIHPTPRPQ